MRENKSNATKSIKAGATVAQPGTQGIAPAAPAMSYMQNPKSMTSMLSVIQPFQIMHTDEKREVPSAQDATRHAEKEIRIKIGKPLVAHVEERNRDEAGTEAEEMR